MPSRTGRPIRITCTGLPNQGPRCSGPETRSKLISSAVEKGLPRRQRNIAFQRQETEGSERHHRTLQSHRRTAGDRARKSTRPIGAGLPPPGSHRWLALRRSRRGHAHPASARHIRAPETACQSGYALAIVCNAVQQQHSAPVERIGMNVPALSVAPSAAWTLMFSSLA